MAKTKIEARAAIAGGRQERKNAVSRESVSPSTRRGSETRERIKAATRAVLERTGYRAMRLVDIADEGGVNVSLIYRYFTGKADITREILADLLDEQRRELRTEQVDRADAFDAIFHANKTLVSMYRSTPGLMRCLLHFDEEEPEFSKMYREVSLEWSRRVARDIARRCPDARLDEGQRLMIAYALGGMVDNFLFEMYVDRNPVFAQTLPDEDAAARFLTIIWHRALYLDNPADTHLKGFAAFDTLR